MTIFDEEREKLMARAVEISIELDKYFGGRDKRGIVVEHSDTPFVKLLKELDAINRELGLVPEQTIKLVLDDAINDVSNKISNEFDESPIGILGGTSKTKWVELLNKLKWIYKRQGYMDENENWIRNH